MNFTPFGSPFTGSIPTATVHQFAAAKFAHNAAGNQVLSLVGGEGGVTYLRPVDPNSFAMATTQGQQSGSGNGAGQQQQTLITLPISTGKPGEQGQQAVQIQVVNPSVSMSGAGSPGSGTLKYHISPISLHQFPQSVLTVAYSPQQNGDGTTSSTAQVHIQAGSESTEADGDGTSGNGGNNSGEKHNEHHPYPLVVVQPQEIILRDGQVDLEKLTESAENKEGIHLAVVKGEHKEGETSEYNGQTTTVASMPATWQSLAAPGSTLADYISRLQGTASLPLSLHHFLKFSPETIKRESAIESSPLGGAELTDGNAGVGGGGGANNPSGANIQEPGSNVGPDNLEPGTKPKRKKRYKKKPPKPRRPRPGQVHIARALDGTTLYCCPECHMAYPDKELLEQHLVGHKIERRFICDICGAGLKRKEHLERHKLGHNPERPFICNVCLKGFKRKEHLNLHYVIHSGEKTEVCTECGKGFYRKDHLRKHARSHIAKRIKEELSNQQQQAQQQAQHLHQQQGVTQPGQQNQQQPLVGTVVLPTATETGATMLMHHQQQ